MKRVIGLLIIFGSFFWSIAMVKSGWFYSFGLGFWGPNGHDGIFHIALAQSLAKGLLINPTFAGEHIKNYHIGFDLLLAVFNRITSIPILNLYFQILPVLLSLLIGIFTYRLVLLWSKSEKASILSTFFVYFGGSLGWILGKGESAFWSQQAISTLINPPFATSLVFLLAGLTLILKRKWFFASLCFGLLIFIKVYAGLLILTGLMAAGLFEFLKEKKMTYLKTFLLTVVISLLLYLPFNSKSSALVEFAPFWFLETMVGLSDRFGWEKLYSAMINYRAGGIWLKAILAYGLAFSIFIFGNLGTRLIFIKELLNRKIDTFKVLLLTVSLAGVVVPMLFVQKGTPWNTIQFFYYSLFLLGILAGVAMEKIKNIYVLLILLATIPTSVITLKDIYIPGRPPAKISVKEMEALNYLKNEPEGIVLTYMFDQSKANEAINNPPRPLYLYESTAYVSAMTNKTVFLEDEVNLNIMDYKWKERRKIIENWYEESNKEIARTFINDNHIKYIYWIKPQRALLGESQLGLTKIFENEEVIIYTTD